MHSKTTWSALLIFLLMGTACSKFNKMQKSNNAQEKLEYADQMFEQKKYNKAQEIYGQIKDSYKGTQKYEQLTYNYTYTYYYMKDYVSAAFYFKNFIEIFPSSDRTEEMAFKEAYCFYMLSPRVELDQSNTEKAISAMQTFMDIYPNSDMVSEATEIIDKCREKLEAKAYRAAKLYYGMGQYRAAGVTYNNMILDYPDSEKGEFYKFMAVKSYFQFAEKSVQNKQKERFQDVVTEYLSFKDFYPESSYLREAEGYYNIAQKNIKTL